MISNYALWTVIILLLERITTVQSPRHKASALCDSAVLLLVSYVCRQLRAFVARWLEWPSSTRTASVPDVFSLMLNFTTHEIYASSGGLLMVPTNLPHYFPKKWVTCTSLVTSLSLWINSVTIRCIYFVCLVVCNSNILDSVYYWSWVDFSSITWQNHPCLVESYVGESVCTYITMHRTLWTLLITKIGPMRLEKNTSQLVHSSLVVIKTICVEAVLPLHKAVR